jgi:ketosteroid isomerase-like protein
MRKRLTWCLPTLVLLASTASSRAQTSEGTEKVVADLERQWLQAQKTSNPELIAPLLADNLVSTSTEGKVTGKAETLADIKSEKWTSAEYTDLKVRVYGNTAIAYGGFRGKGTDASGKPLDEDFRWTDTWVKMPNGKWQCVASQATTVKM